MTDWSWQGAVPPRDLTETRLQLHWAGQLVAALAGALVAPEEDDSHTSLTFNEEGALLMTRTTRTETPLRAALALDELALVLLDDEPRQIARLPLEGKTLDDGFQWLTAEISKHSGQTSPELKLESYDMPEHPLQRGARFEKARPEAFEELRRWFINAKLAFDARRGDSPLRLWPHHFDLAFQTDSIGVGLSPGDGRYDEPYCYVSPWPYPTPESWPKLEGGGHWHTEDFVAAVLEGTKIVEGSGAEQASRLSRFLDSAIEASRKLIGKAGKD